MFKKRFIIYCSLLLLTFLTGCHSSVTTDSSEVNHSEETNATATEASLETTMAETTLEESIPDVKNYIYDELQTIFINLTADISPEELEAIITEKGLYYTSQEYNKLSGGKEISYKIAYTQEIAKQKYADSGDYLDLNFDLENNNRLMHAQYCNLKSLGPSALFYCYGTWFDFRESNAKDYAGYYIVNPLSREDGITIQYSNGNEVTTHYFKCDSAEQAIQILIDSIE